MTVDDIAKLWTDSRGHIELVDWLIWNLSNERTSDSIPCPVIFAWELTEKISDLKIGNPSETIEYLRSAEVIVPRTIEAVKRRDDQNRVLPCDPYAIDPHCWHITGNVRSLRLALPATRIEERSERDRENDRKTNVDVVDSDYSERLWIRDVAFLLDLSPRTVSRRLKSGDLPVMPGTKPKARKLRVLNEHFPPGLKRNHERQKKLSERPSGVN